MPTRKQHPLKLNAKSWDKQKVMDFLLSQIACSSFSLGTILKNGCDGNSLPDYSTIMEWLDGDEDLSLKYARARAAQAEFMADEMLDIADNGTNDYALDDEGKPVLDREHIQRSRVRIDTRKWLMGKLKPKKYGEKIDVNHGGQPDNPLLTIAKNMQGGALPIAHEREKDGE